MLVKMYQLFEVIGNDAGASNKARSDVRIIGEKLGFSTIVVNTSANKWKIKLLNKIVYLFNLKKALNSIEEGSILLVQIPVLNLAGRSHRIIEEYCRRKKIQIICIIHDVNDIRSNLPPESNSEFYNLLREAKAVISHNQKMTEYLVGQEIDQSKIVNLELFDYLLDKEKEIGEFSRSVTIAGNLNPEKVGYIGHIKEIVGAQFELYGPNYNETCGSQFIHYNGVVNSNDLPYLLDKGFGLVWDGDSIKTCSGNYGRYLKYNNPHKLSLYLAAGLPVVIWSEAAEADFVKENHIGIVLDSLVDLPNTLNQIDEDEYEYILDNVKTIQRKVVSGGFVTHALEWALNSIES